MEPIFNEPDENQMAPQPFGLIAAAGILYIIVSYASLFANKYATYFNYVVCTALYVFTSAGFIKYLQNFKAAYLVLLIKLRILVIIPAFFVVATTNEYDALILQQDAHSQYIIRNVLYYAFYLASFLDLAGCILFGIGLLKIKNDFVGYLKHLGIINTFVVPLPYLFIIAAGYYQPLGAYLSAHLPFHLLVHTLLFIIPTMALTLIFYRAKKYQERHPQLM